MTPEPQVQSTSIPRALMIGAGPEALLGVEPMFEGGRFRVDFLERGDTPYIDDSPAPSRSGRAVLRAG